MLTRASRTLPGAMLCVALFLSAGSSSAGETLEFRDFTKFGFRIGLQSNWAITPGDADTASDEGQLFAAESALGMQTFSCNYKRIPPQFMPADDDAKMQVLMAAIGTLADVHRAYSPLVDGPTVGEHDGIRFVQTRVTERRGTELQSNTAFYHVFLRWDFFIFCGGYHRAGQGEQQTAITESIEAVEWSLD